MFTQAFPEEPYLAFFTQAFQFGLPPVRSGGHRARGALTGHVKTWLE